MLAEIDANGWSIIIAAIGVIILQLAQMALSVWRESRNNASREEAKKGMTQYKEETLRVAGEVKKDLHVLTARQNEKLEEIKAATKDLSNNINLQADVTETKENTEEIKKDVKDLTLPKTP